MRSCQSNACKQGRLPCPTPLACELPEPEDDTLMVVLRDLVFVSITIGVVGAVAVVAWVWFA